MGQGTASLRCASGAALVALGVTIWMPAFAVPAAGACGASAGTLLQSIALATDGQRHIVRTIDLPAGTDVLLTATETGVDVRLEVQAGDVARISDNPIRRWGPQRVVLPAGARRGVSANVIAKEGVRGRLQLEVSTLPASTAVNPCAAALRLLAEGDAFFARGQLISLGIAEAPAGSAQREYAAAAQSYQRAASVLVSRSASALLAQAHLAAAAALYQGTQSWVEALRLAQLASDEYRSAGDEYGLNRARAMAAAAEMEVGLSVLDAAPADAGAGQRMASMLEHARQTLNEVAASHARRNQRYDQALALNNVGLAYYYEDKYDPAIRAYQGAFALYERLGERRRQAQTLQNLAVVQQEIARFASARESYARVLQLIDETADPRLYADVLNNLAVTEVETGDPDAALRHFSGALTILTRIQSTREQARSLHGIGTVYYAIGNRREALDYFDRALAVRSPEVDTLGRTDSLRASANALRDIGRWPEAIARREEALRLAQSAVLRARILVELARDEAGRGATGAALSRAQEALSDGAGGDHIVQARALVERSRLRLAQKAYEPAQRDADDAVTTFRSYELPASTFEALMLRANIACASGDKPAARGFVDEALSLTEQLRRASTSPALRTTLWQSLRPAFDFKIALVAAPQACGGNLASRRAGEADLEALETAEQSRSRALEDYLELARARDGARTESRAEAKRRALFEEVAARRMQIEALSQRASPSDPRLRALQLEVTAMKRNIDILDSEIAAPLKQAGSREGAATRLRSAIETISPGAAVVEYWLGNDNTYAWLITKGRARMVDLGSTSRITAAAHRLHDSLRTFASVPVEARVQRARDLYALIIAPLPDEARSADALYFIPDGALHYVPFSVLAAGSGDSVKYLVEDHDVAVAPSLLFTAAPLEKARAGASPALLMVSDPVYTRTDARFSGNNSPLPVAPEAARAGAAPTLRGTPVTGEWRRLPGSGREAAAIATLFPASSIDSLSGFEATREELLKRDLSRYRIVHIATHGLADAEAPQLSTLVLSTYSRSGNAIPGEVFAGDLLLRRLNADLVVLSACETSLGAQTAGEGLLGLRYAAHASGARSVVASLWPVADAIGAEIMGDFYSRVVRERRTPTAALSQAIRAARRKWTDPALWGVFEVSRGVREPVLH